MSAYEMRISDWSSDVCPSDLLQEVRGDGRVPPRPAARHDRTGLGGDGLLEWQEALFSHPLERIVAAAERGVHVHVRALPHVALQDRSDMRRDGTECVNKGEYRGVPEI